jgi:hypothetical protein
VPTFLGQANIIIDQATLVVPGVAGKSRNDGVLNELVTLRNADGTNITQYAWYLKRPRGSTAVLSAPKSATCQFTPDVEGSYGILLLVNEGQGKLQAQTRILAVKTVSGQRFPVQGETNEANWTSDYTGDANETGWWEDLIDILKAVAGGVDGSIVTVNAEAGLPASRRLVAGNGVVFNDGGPGSTLEIRSTSGVIRYPDVVGEAENLVSSRGTKPGTRDATNYGQVNLGSQSNNTYGTKDNYAAVLSGLDNLASSEGAFVGGGQRNRAGDIYAFVGGGGLNFADGQYATISGGHNNEIDADNCTIGGGDSNIINDAGSTIGGGQGNVIETQYGAIAGGYTNTQTAGGYGAIAGGFGNSMATNYGTIAGGYTNTMPTGDYSFIGGGYTNNTSQLYSAIAGGFANDITAGVAGFIGGGYQNQISADYAVVAGGYENTADGNYSAVAGGFQCRALYPWSAVIGGYINLAQGNYAIVAGGHSNNTNGQFCGVFAGSMNLAESSYSVCLGGEENYSGGDYSAVAGGTLNQALAQSSFIGGGSNNIASNTSVAILGSDNTSQGNYSFCIGRSCFASNDYTIALGRSSQPQHAGSHVYKDGTASSVQSTADNQLTLSYEGGIRMLFPTSQRLRKSGYAGSNNYVEEVHGSVSTTNATPGTATIITIPSGQDVHIKGVLKGKRSGTADARVLFFEASYTNNGGTVALVGAALLNTANSNGTGSTWATAVNINGSTLEVAYTGAAAQTVRWTWKFECSIGGAT